MRDEDFDFQRYLPPARLPEGPCGSFGRPTTGAAFLSQLIAERQHLEVQRLRRRAGIAQAVDAYAMGLTMGVRRMPKGYRKTVVC